MCLLLTAVRKCCRLYKVRNDINCMMMVVVSYRKAQLRGKGLDMPMIYAPVMIITCNRDQHLARCIESLQKNEYAKDTELYISVDYPWAEQYIEGWKNVCELLKRPIEGFKRVTIYYQEQNLGFYKNKTYLYNKVYEQHDRVIFTEDDNEFSPNFIEYIDKGLMQFEKDPNVFAICGYGYDYKFDAQGNNVIALTNCCVWGCGFWREKEKKVYDQLRLSVWEKKARNPFIMGRLYRNRKRLFSRMLGVLLSEEQDEMIEKRDISRGIVMALNGWYTVNPVISKVRNWGWDGTGLNIPGIKEKQEEYENQKIDGNLHFEYSSIRLVPDIVNDHLLDANGEWNIDRAKWYNDPLTYFLYWLLGKDKFFKYIRGKKEKEKRSV